MTKKIFKTTWLCCLCFILNLNTIGQTKDQIRIINANEGTSHPTFLNTHILNGNVIFEHDSTKMFCDSAYFYLDSNSFQAFSNIRVIKGDSIKLTGDSLLYRGISKTAVLQGNVIYMDRQMRMVTPKLHYDLNTEIGSYDSTATITNTEDKNTLFSKKGYYHGKTQTVYFKDSVRLKNDDYIMISDTLVYNTSYKITSFFGPTEIISKDNKIYCENGVYNTENEISHLWNNAEIYSNTQIIKGDSIYYDRNSGVGRIYGNLNLSDTASDLKIIGDYGAHYELLDSTAVEGNAFLFQVEKEDSLLLLSDNIYIRTDSLNENKKIAAFANVNIYQNEFQGKCDSLIYNDSDSLMKFYKSPILWSDKNQITGDFIQAKTKNNQIDILNVETNSFIISKIDSVKFDQIKGRDLNAFFKEGKISKVDVLGNGETLYYIQNEDSLYLEANQARCAKLNVLFKDQSIETIKFLDAPSAKYKSIQSLSMDETFFEGFKWEEIIRPKKTDFPEIKDSEYRIFTRLD